MWRPETGNQALSLGVLSMEGHQEKNQYIGRYKTILGKDSEVDEIKRFSKIDI